MRLLFRLEQDVGGLCLCNMAEYGKRFTLNVKLTAYKSYVSEAMVSEGKR